VVNTNSALQVGFTERVAHTGVESMHVAPVFQSAEIVCPAAYKAALSGSEALTVRRLRVE